MPASASSFGTYSLISAGDPERALAYWRRLQEHWPSFAPKPKTLHRMSVRRACGCVGEALGSGVLVVPGENEEDDAHTFQLMDHLWEQMVPGVVLMDQMDERKRRLGGQGVFVTSSQTPIGEVAATLFALGSRQTTIDELRREVRTARRFHRGIRGEMDKIHEELQLAASVQREFLPRRLPELPGIDIGVLFRPCGYVSGDIYDVRRLDEHHIGFFLADAVGHGVPAALMTMVLSRGLVLTDHTPMGERIIPPSEVLERLNTDLIERHCNAPRFATAVYGIIDIRDNMVTLAGAGHPPPLVIDQDGEIQKITTHGGLLGVFAEDMFDEVVFELSEGESLMLYSDGFETAFPKHDADEHSIRRPTEHFLERFQDAAEVRRDEGAARAMEALRAMIDQQSGSLHQIDDLTAMVLAPKAAAGAGVRDEAEEVAA